MPSLQHQCRIPYLDSIDATIVYKTLFSYEITDCLVIFARLGKSSIGGGIDRTTTINKRYIDYLSIILR